jgi:hypothetical protein
MEHFEKREKERDARAAKRDAFIKETEGTKNCCWKRYGPGFDWNT